MVECMLSRSHSLSLLPIVLVLELASLLLASRVGIDYEKELDKGSLFSWKPDLQVKGHRHQEQVRGLL